MLSSTSLNELMRQPTLRTLRWMRPPEMMQPFATDSMVSHGCIISGGRIHRSVLSVGCRINSFSEVEESVLFERVRIGRHAKIRRCIIDKDVEVPSGVEVGFNLEADRKRFFVTENGLVVIPKRAKLDDEKMWRI